MFSQLYAKLTALFVVMLGIGAKSVEGVEKGIETSYQLKSVIDWLTQWKGAVSTKFAQVEQAVTDGVASANAYTDGKVNTAVSTLTTAISGETQARTNAVTYLTDELLKLRLRNSDAIMTFTVVNDTKVQLADIITSAFTASGKTKQPSSSYAIDLQSSDATAKMDIVKFDSTEWTGANASETITFETDANGNVVNVNFLANGLAEFAIATNAHQATQDARLDTHQAALQAIETTVDENYANLNSRLTNLTNILVQAASQNASTQTSLIQLLALSPNA